MSYPISDEAQDQLDQWPPTARVLFTELLEDAGSDLQRELILRAVASAHTPGEVHAFADQLRAMSDEDAYEACTLHDTAPEDYTVSQLLRAEADPLFAFELKGGTIEPNEVTPAFTPPPRQAVKIRNLNDEPMVDPLVAALSRKRSSESFEAESPGVRPKSLDWNELQPNRPPPPKKDDSLGSSQGTRFLEGILGEATRSLQISWKEHDVDLPGGMSMQEAVASATGALARGIPVPCAVGTRAGDHRLFVVMLQLSTSGKNRAIQLYNPFSTEVLWVNEGDLLASYELPFANKMNRRITRIVLPQSLRAAF